MRILFIPECYADTTLTDFFLRNKGLRMHQRGIAKVASIMEKSGSKYYRIVGIIDDDKRLPRYFNMFLEINRIGNVILRQKPNSEEYLIVIQPELERFLMNCSKKLNINLAEFNLPDSLEDFIAVTKNVAISDNHNFKKLLKSLKDSEDFKGLEQFFTELQHV
jgi:hypothetical protein